MNGTYWLSSGQGYQLIALLLGYKFELITFKKRTNGVVKGLRAPAKLEEGTNFAARAVYRAVPWHMLFLPPMSGASNLVLCAAGNPHKFVGQTLDFAPFVVP